MKFNEFDLRLFSPGPSSRVGRATADMQENLREMDAEIYALMERREEYRAAEQKRIKQLARAGDED